MKNKNYKNGVMLNLFQHLHLKKDQEEEILKQVQDDDSFFHDTIDKRAFTLIELLVVVLIIGILAAIALPQYQAAVMKSRYTELMILGNAIYRSRQAHFLATGSYGTDFTELDLELPGCSMRNSGNKINAIYHCSDKKFSCDIYDNWTHCHMDSDTLYYSILSPTGKRQCGALKADNTANQVCKSAGAIYSGYGDTLNWYVF